MRVDSVDTTRTRLVLRMGRRPPDMECTCEPGTADKGMVLHLEVLSIPYLKKLLQHVTKCYRGHRSCFDSLVEPKQRKMEMRF
jgi:hypothetical protein